MSDSFVRERILWRAGQHRLLERRCILFSDASTEQSTAVSVALGENVDGVLLFWDSAERWTLLAETFVASWHHGALHRVGLDVIGRVSVPSLASDAESPDKREADHLLLETSGQRIWAPSGPELFALMNLLMMFPLRRTASGIGRNTDG